MQDGTGTQVMTKQDEPGTFPAMLKMFKSEIARALPSHLNGDRMCRIALTEFRKNPTLGQCDPKSVFAAVIMASQCGLEPGLMGQAFLVPFNTRKKVGGQWQSVKECQFIPGYQGLIELVRRGGSITRIEAHVVHTKDKFTYKTGLTTTLEHEPCMDGDPGDPRLVYAVAEFKGGGYHVEVMTKAQVEAIRNQSSGYRSAVEYNKDSPWTTDTDEMWRKTVIRRICKYLPKSAELSLALAANHAADRGGQRADPLDVIEGTWAPPEDADVIDVEVRPVDPAAKAREALAESAAKRGPGRPRKDAPVVETQPVAPRLEPTFAVSPSDRCRDAWGKANNQYQREEYIRFAGQVVFGDEGRGAELWTRDLTDAEIATLTAKVAELAQAGE